MESKGNQEESMIKNTAKEIGKQVKNQAEKVVEGTKEVAGNVKKSLNFGAGKKDDEPEVDLETAIKAKMDLSQMAEKYEPHRVEKHWYQWWKDNKVWHADSEKAAMLPPEKKFTMILPPPNVTGYLHIGHALMLTVEDTICRWHRMKGNVVEWTPGTDHAGIGTQTQVEKYLLKTEGKTKRDYGREEFLNRVFDWQKRHGSRILEQCGRIGAGMDWDRYFYTMNDKLSKSVTEAFVRLFEKGLIYRANRLVNWCCKLQTALSDVECDSVDIEDTTKLKVPNHEKSYEFGSIWSFSYKIKDSDEKIIIATTRPETILGDVAIAVHPQDARYKHLHGKEIVHPFISDRKMKIVLDDQLVDMNFGTGAVKITPAHDHNDYNCGKKHDLEFINVITDDGKMNENAGPYAGMMRFDCRVKIIKDLEAMGQYHGVEKNKMRLQFCSKSNDVIEPMLKPQWYVNCQEIGKELIKLVKEKELIITPDYFEAEWFRWLENIQDWCISRQIWWGHRCPAYLVTIKGQPKPDSNDSKYWVVAQSHEEALEKAAVKFGVPKDQITLDQDEDVLDTWFSSSLLPFSVFGWPDVNNVDLKAFYPGHLLETGSDILFFWVARMCMMGVWLMDKPPFKAVYLHQIVRDEKGEKMSKSKGNVIDPLDVIDGATIQKLVDDLAQSALTEKEIKRNAEEKTKKFTKYKGIPECGADSLRFGLLAYTIQARFINLDVEKIIGWRMFGNKVWQSYRFATQKLPKDFKYNRAALDISSLSLVDQWILHRLNVCTEEQNKHYKDYNFGPATISFHNYWQYELCDIYLEAIKPVFARQDDKSLATAAVLFTALEQGLRLLHPIMPFITEELYQKLPVFEEKKFSISNAPYPESEAELSNKGTQLEADLDYIMGVVRQIRSLSASINLPPSAKPEVFLVFIKGLEKGAQLRKLVETESEFILTLSKVKDFKILESSTDVPKGCILGLANKTVEVHLNVKEFVKIDEEVVRLEKKIKQTETFIQNQLKKMNIKDYETKVPEKVQIENKEKLDGFHLEKEQLEQALSSMKQLL